MKYVLGLGGPESFIQDDGLSGIDGVTMIGHPFTQDSQRAPAAAEKFGWVSLEGYIVGKLWLNAMEKVQGRITRAKFLANLRGRKFDLGGLRLDYSNDNQGSDLVILTNLTPDGFQPMSLSA